MRVITLLFLAAWMAGAQSGEDPAAEMVRGMERYVERLHGQVRTEPSVEKLRHLLGVVDARVAASLQDGPVLGETASLRAASVRWRVLDGVSAEGVHLWPRGERKGCVVAVSDALPERFAAAQEFAAAGYEVLAPVLLDLGSQWSGNPAVRMSKLPHREWIYRMAFPVGRHPIGYEVQKVLAAVDWFAGTGCARITVYGSGEGAPVARFAAALDKRIASAEFHDPPAVPLRDQPVHRNLFGIRKYDVPVRSVELLRTATATAGWTVPEGRMERQVGELVRHVQGLVRSSRRYRDELWAKTPADVLGRRFLTDVIGELPEERTPLRLRTRPVYDGGTWEATEVRFDVRPEFGGYGILLTPKKIEGRRPLVVVQHGLNGTPQALYGQTTGRDLEVYRNFGAQLADLGFVVYLPQNPYRGEFRHLAKLANPLGLSLYSLIRAQYQVMLDWLTTLPYVDAERVGFYGLSYGGKTALRIPPFDPRYKAVVCAGDFNEWIVKLTTPDEPWSYVYTQEYEILEWDMAHVANHAELAMLMAPRRFLVERGHRDGVGIDEWVSYEYARVRRYFDERGLGVRTGIAYFNGPHRVDGPEAIRFLRSALGW